MPTPANALNVTAAGQVYFDGTATFNSSALTQHDVLVGGASNAIVSVSPSTTGLVLTSNGVSSDPSFGIAPIAGGGTNASSFGTSSGVVKYDGTRLVTSTTVQIDSSNRLTNSSQTAVFVKIGTPLTNVTGDGTLVDPVKFDTIQTQQGSAYSTSTGIFTCPVAGFYYIYAQVTFTGLAAGNTSGQTKIVSSQGDVLINNFNPGACMDSNNKYTQCISGFIHIAASGTFKIQAIVSGGTKIVGIDGEDSGEYTYLNIFLVC